MLSHIYKISGKKIFRWYKEVLSGYTNPNVQNQLHEHDTVDKALVDFDTKEKKKVFVPIFKPGNFGKNMAIDDKNIGGEGYTIISNKDTGKIAVMMMTTKAKIIVEILSQIPTNILFSVETITKDLAEGYDWVSRQMFIKASRIADKFHVIKLALQSLQDIRVRYRQEALREERERVENYKCREAESREQAKQRGEKHKKRSLSHAKKYENGETKKEVLARSRYLLFQYESQWRESQAERAKILFREFPEIEKAYKIICSFRAFYNIKPDKNIAKARIKLKKWYKKVGALETSEIQNFASTVKRHEPQILAYFHDAHTNAFAESLNSKIQRFVRTNFGIRNRDFFHFRLMKFLA